MHTEKFKVMFRGRIIDDFDAQSVRTKASKRLNASPEQIEMLFSGRTAVLKKGIDRALAERYLTSLRAIGMEVFLEPSAKASPAPAKTPQPEFVDLEKTQLVAPEALTAYLRESSLPEQTPDTAQLARAAMLQAALPELLPAEAKADHPDVAVHEGISTLVGNADALSQYINSAGHFSPTEIEPPAAPSIMESPARQSDPADTGRDNADLPEQKESRGPSLFGAPFANAQSLQDALSRDVATQEREQETMTVRKKLLLAVLFVLLFALAWCLI